MTRLILTDIDETVLRCGDALEAYCAERLGRPPKHPLRNHFYVCTAFDTTREEGNALVRDFWKSPAFRNLAPEECAAIHLPILYAKGYRFVAITACGDDPEIEQVRADNLARAFGFRFEAVHCTGEHGDKSAFLARYSPAIWVEDNFSNAVVGASYGHRSFLISRGYNEGHEHPAVTRVRDWHDIVEMLG